MTNTPSAAHSGTTERQTMPATANAQLSWILYGPQGSGKSRHADRIARSLGLRHILEDWRPGQRVPLTDTLVITHEEPSCFDPKRVLSRTISIDAALKRVRAMQGAKANRDPANVRRRPAQQQRRAA